MVRATGQRTESCFLYFILCTPVNCSSSSAIHFYCGCKLTFRMVSILSFSLYTPAAATVAALPLLWNGLVGAADGATPAATNGFVD